jgi:molybdopterin molybdotransferase
LRGIGVAAAGAHILERITPVSESEEVELSEAGGRVLARAARARFDVPPQDNAAVDGFALAAATANLDAGATLRVRGELRAGLVDQQPLEAGEAIHIMTGAPLPPGVDRVIPQEKVEVGDEWVRIGPETRSGANIRRRGEDIRCGSEVLPSGRRLTPACIGVLAALGEAQIRVWRRPRIALLSTGDEVAPPGASRRPGQIYDSNRYSLGASLRQHGAEVVDLGIVGDDRAALAEALTAGAQKADALITSGGVSVGLHDLLKQVLSELGQVDFWQVRMTPGRPLAFGSVGTKPLFGLPGNPVAALVSYRLFVRPALERLAGVTDWEGPYRFQATAAERLPKKTGRMEFKRGILGLGPDGPTVRSTGPQGSGILTSLVRANCLIVLEEERGPVEPGEPVEIELLD